MVNSLNLVRDYWLKLKVKITTWWGHVPLVRGVSVWLLHFMQCCLSPDCECFTFCFDNSMLQLTLYTSHPCYISCFDFLFALLALSHVFAVSYFRQLLSFIFIHLLTFDSVSLSVPTSIAKICARAFVSAWAWKLVGPLGHKTKRF